MNDEFDPGSAARAEAMRRAKEESQGQQQPNSMAEKIHSLLPEWLSARAAILKKRKQLADLDAQTAPEGSQRP